MSRLVLILYFFFSCDVFSSVRLGGDDLCEEGVASEHDGRAQPHGGPVRDLAAHHREQYGQDAQGQVAHLVRVRVRVRVRIRVRIRVGVGVRARVRVRVRVRVSTPRARSPTWLGLGFG